MPQSLRFAFLAAGLTLLSSFACGQTDTPVTTNNGTAPQLPGQTVTPLPSAPLANPPVATQTPTPVGVEPRIHELPDTLQAAPDIPTDAPTLTLVQAEQLALQHNPRVDIAHLLALAQGQQLREQRAALLPTFYGNATALEADNGSRITSGALNNPVVYSRAAFGATLNQLITDFGRTRHLVASASLRSQAAESTLAATRFDILFAVDMAFYRALGAQTLITVAHQTVQARRATANQINALANARLRSTLDLSFANADLAQAQLQLLDARNESIEAQANLSALIGDERSMMYKLVDETPASPQPAPMEIAPLVQLAFQSRPDLRSLQQTAEAQHKFAKAESDLLLPTVSALGAAGDSPTHNASITHEAYGAVGVIVSVPIFNGFLDTSRAAEAKLRASAADAQVKQQRETIARDVTTTVLQAQSNFNRIAVAQQLARQASSVLQLAQTRYDLGLSSIVELSQAQLLQTQAQIQLTNARYAYQGSLAAIRYQTGQ